MNVDVSPYTTLLLTDIGLVTIIVRSVTAGKGLVINYGEGGGLQNGKIAGPKLFAPPPQDRVKLFAPPLLKSGKFTRPPYNMAKTSSYRVKSTPKLFVPPLQNG